MADVTVPHFDLPFRRALDSGLNVPVVVDQDTPEDVTNCVEAIMRTEIGSRTDLPTFGITDPLFQQIPVDTATTLAEISAHEDRASVVLNQTPDLIDSLKETITAEVGLRGEQQNG